LANQDGQFRERPEYKLEGTPADGGGVLVCDGGIAARGIALDAVTGELLWIHGEHEGARRGGSTAAFGRGLAYWSDGKDERILLCDAGYQLICLMRRRACA